MINSYKKKCCQCKKIKDRGEFHKDRSSNDGRASRCSKCDNSNHTIYRKENPDKINKNNIKFRKLYKGKRRELIRAYDLKRNYGLTINSLEQMIVNQKGTCAICHIPIKKWDKRNSNKDICVDHDHMTNKVRGLLCRQCNTGLAMFKDNILILKGAINYLSSKPKEENRYGL